MSAALPLDPEPTSQVVAAFDHINDEHPDTVLFVARHLGAPDATAAALVGVDTEGIDVRVEAGAGAAELRWPFPAPVASVEEVQAQLMSALLTARAADPDGPLTSLEAEFAESTSIPVHMAEVGSRRALTPNLVEVELRVGPAPSAPTPDTFYFALVGPPGVVDASYGIDRFQSHGEQDGVRGAYVTARRLAPDPATATATLTLWVVLHGHDDGVVHWLATAEPGSSLGLWGPRTDFDPPADAPAALLVADETGAAAVAAGIERLGASTRVVVVLEVADETCRVPLPEHPGLELHWIHRDGRVPGVGDALLDAVRTLDLTGDRWWAFGGAESRQISAVRRHLREDLGWPAERVSMTGYWRRSG